MIAAQEVQQILLARQERPPQQENNLLGLIFGLLMSLTLTGALVAWGLMWFAPEMASRRHLAFIIPTTWLICYCIGYLVKDTMGLADPFYEQANSAQDSWFRRDQADDWMMAGCLVAVLQFLCGSVYVCIHTLLGAASSPQPAIPALATPVLTLLANQSDREVSAAELYEVLRDSRLKVDQKHLHQTLQWLLQQRWIFTSGSGYRANREALGINLAR